MDWQRRNFPLVLTLAAACVTPVFGQAFSGSESVRSIPDFSGMGPWASGFEPLSWSDRARQPSRREKHGRHPQAAGDYPIYSEPSPRRW
jgi:hypothetical protein